MQDKSNIRIVLVLPEKSKLLWMNAVQDSLKHFITTNTATNTNIDQIKYWQNGGKRMEKHDELSSNFQAPLSYNLNYW